MVSTAFIPGIFFSLFENHFFFPLCEVDFVPVAPSFQSLFFRATSLPHRNVGPAPPVRDSEFRRRRGENFLGPAFFPLSSREGYGFLFLLFFHETTAC